ncbi:MAG: hypothetical protein PHS02_04180 [Candidatus ainarchaeum sp.]|nr:hypothetical protein [Candidatus ainarchaeum sp.]
MEKPVSAQKLGAIMLKKFVEMGLLEEKKSGAKTLYFLTDQGRMLLANFGIDEKDLY